LKVFVRLSGSLSSSSSAGAEANSPAELMAASAGRVLRVLTYPHATLRAVCAPLAALAPPPPAPPSPLGALCADLLATVRAQRGLGLAAPQVGHALRLFAMRVPAARTEAEARRLSAPARRALAAAPPAFVVAANPRILSDAEEAAEGGGGGGGGGGARGARGAAAPAPASASAPAPPAAAPLRIGWEACLSLPGGGSLVRRRARVRVEYCLLAASDARLLARERELRRIALRELRERREGARERGGAAAAAARHGEAGAAVAAEASTAAASAAPAPAAAAAAAELAAAAAAAAEEEAEEEADAESGPLLVRETLEGLPAVVFQHELDHLDGVLITDREERAFRLSTLERETEEAQMRFAQGLARFYADDGAFEES